MMSVHGRSSAPRLRGLGAALIVAGLLGVAAPVAAATATAGSGSAASGPGVVVTSGSGSSTVTGPSGQTLTVSPTSNLAPGGETVAVTGTGYAIAGFDLATEGLYVGLCVDRGAALSPSPCIGGADLSGAGGSSRWVTNDPYPGTPAVPIAADGSFATTITIPRADEFVDCAALPAGQSCKVVTRMDHRASGDRTQDVKVPVTFGSGPVTPAPTITVAPATGLDPAGATVVVSGTGFSTAAPGVTVAYGPAAGDPVDPDVFGATITVPSSTIAANGSWSVSLPGIAAAYTDADGTVRDFSAGGGRISTFRSGGTADPTGAWRASRPVAFAGAPVADTTTGLAISPTSVTAGTSVVMTATVATTGAIEATAATGSAPAGPRAAVTGGTVQFSDGATSLGTAELGPDGRATRTASFGRVGAHPVTARFLGADGVAASTSSAVTVTVTAAPGPGPGPDPGPDPDLTPSGTRTGTGVNGQTITATPVDNLDPRGTSVRVEGTGFTTAAGFDRATDGMYLSFCVDQGPGVQPSPCVGGADTEGSSGSSQWVTNNPYEGVPASAVTPVAADGSFSTTITVKAADEFVDCLALAAGGRCVITTRMDHRATADRSQDVKVPVCFAGEAACATEPIRVSETPVGDDVFTGYALDPSTSAGGTRTGDLARTGFEGRSLLPVGLVLIGLGTAAVLASRRTSLDPRRSDLT